MTVPAKITPVTIRRWALGARRRLHAPPGELSVVTVGPSAIQRLNRQWRHRDQPTNVLSFQFNANPPKREPILGEVFLCPAVIRREAPDYNQTYAQHFRFLLEHGLIHLLGYDHATVAQQRRWKTFEHLLST